MAQASKAIHGTVLGLFGIAGVFYLIGAVTPALVCGGIGFVVEIAAWLALIGGAGRIDTASRLIKAEPSQIYAAFAAPASLEAWLPPLGMTGKVLAFDFREGGLYRLRLTYNEPGHMPGKTSGHSDEVEVRFVRLIPNKRIGQAVRFNSDNPEFADEMWITWTFDREQNGTRVTVACENVPDGIRPEDHEAGLNSSLGNLASFVERSLE